MTKTPTIIPCACGCGSSGVWNRMKFIKRGRRKVLVLPGCSEHAEQELAAGDELIALVISMRGLFFWQRWHCAAEVFRLRLAAEQRHFPDARSRAFMAMLRVCLPRKIGSLLPA